LGKRQELSKKEFKNGKKIHEMEEVRISIEQRYVLPITGLWEGGDKVRAPAEVGERRR